MLADLGDSTFNPIVEELVHHKAKDIASGKKGG